jgi:hypothetical protein
MATFASTTTVAPEQSRMEIERLLFKFGCSEFGVVTKLNEGAITFVTRGVRILIKIPLPDPRPRRSRWSSCRTWSRPTVRRLPSG